MRLTAAILLSLAFAVPAAAVPSIDEICADAAKRKEIEKGLKILDKYFKAEYEAATNARKAAAASGAQAAAQGEFIAWLATTGASLGLDLQGQPDLVIEMLDRGREKYLETKIKKGSIEYV